METTTMPKLDVQTRDATGAKLLRGQKKIPLVYYGKNIDNKHLACDYEEFRKLYRKAGENTIISMVIDGKEPVNILIQDVQFDPVRDRYSHVDVIHVNMNEEVHTFIPIVLEGVAPAVKDLGGTLVQSLAELEVKCLPMDLPQSIKGSVESLVDFHTSLHVSDLNVPAKVKVLNDPEQTVATVAAIQEEKEVVVEVAPEAGATPAAGGATPETAGKEAGGKTEQAKKE